MLTKIEDIEKYVIGCMLLDEDVAVAVSEELKAKDFSKQSHQFVFTAIQQLIKEQLAVDVITVSDELAKICNIRAVGGSEFLKNEFVSLVSGVSDYKIYVDKIKHFAQIHTLFDAGKKILGFATQSSTREKALQLAEEYMFDLTRQETQKQDLTLLGEQVNKVLDNFEKPTQNLGLSTGFAKLDNLLGGLNKTDLIVIGARPSVGKTSFAMNVVTNVAKAGANCVVYSLEMSKEQLIQRAICSLAKVSSTKCINGTLEEADWQKIFKACETMKDFNIYINDSPGMSPALIYFECYKKKTTTGLDLIVIDYLQLLSEDGCSKNRQKVVSDYSKALKLIAKELEVPVVVLAQLNRNVEQRESKIPTLSDLRDSGSIEQDADVVVLLSKCDIKNDVLLNKYEVENVVRLDVAKHRNGETGVVHYNFNSPITTFEELED